MLRSASAPGRAFGDRRLVEYGQAHVTDLRRGAPASRQPAATVGRRRVCFRRRRGAVRWRVLDVDEVALADQDQREHGGGERDDRADQDDRVQAVDEAAPSRRRRRAPRSCGGTACIAWRMLPLLIDAASACEPLASGLPASFEITELETSLARMLPSAATPVAIPIWRKRRVDPGRHAGARGLDDADRGRGERHVDQAGADAGDDHPRQQMGPVVGRREPAHQQQAGADQHESRADQQPGRDVAGEPTGEPRR